MLKTVLHGITWGHSRGITPLLAYSQRFSERNPHVEIIWKKRSLQEFADFPIEKLTEQYDLLIIDHPWVGCAAATGCVLPLEQYLSKEYLDDQREHSVGYSHASYEYNGHQWALAIDAATPAASFRSDLFEAYGEVVPDTWEELMELASKKKVAVPAIAIDLLMNFYTFCIAMGTQPFLNEDEVIDKETGIRALETMKTLYSLVDSKMFNCNPIAVAELMTTTNDYWYCPFAYGYSNYSRAGYAPHILTYGELVRFNGNNRLRSTIGGTGLAVSSSSKHSEIALQFAKEIVSGACQSTLYVEHGGQPGHRSAWVAEKPNLLCNNYFKHVLPVMERGYMRPRYNGYLLFQDHAGDPVKEFMMGSGKAATMIEKLNDIYRKSLASCLTN